MRRCGTLSGWATPPPIDPAPLSPYRAAQRYSMSCRRQPRRTIASGRLLWCILYSAELKMLSVLWMECQNLNAVFIYQTVDTVIKALKAFATLHYLLRMKFFNLNIWHNSAGLTTRVQDVLNKQKYLISTKNNAEFVFWYLPCFSATGNCRVIKKNKLLCSLTTIDRFVLCAIKRAFHVPLFTFMAQITSVESVPRMHWMYRL